MSGDPEHTPVAQRRDDNTPILAAVAIARTVRSVALPTPPCGCTGACR